MSLKTTNSSTPSALPALSLPISSPSDLGTVMEVTMFSAPPNPPSGTRIEEGKYIYIRIRRVQRNCTQFCVLLHLFPKNILSLY